MQPEETTMPGKPEVDVALFGGEPQIRRALEAILHRFRAPGNCFQEPEHCLQMLAERPCEVDRVATSTAGRLFLRYVRDGPAAQSMYTSGCFAAVRDVWVDRL